MPQMSNYSGLARQEFKRCEPDLKHSPRPTPGLCCPSARCVIVKKPRLDGYLQKIASKFSHQTLSHLFLSSLGWWIVACGSHKNRIHPYLCYFRVCPRWFGHSQTALVEDPAQHYDRLLSIVLVPVCCQNSPDPAEPGRRWTPEGVVVVSGTQMLAADHLNPVNWGRASVDWTCLSSTSLRRSVGVEIWGI